MFGSLAGIASDVIKVASAPVEIATDVARCVTKPVANIAEETKKEVKAALKDLEE